MNLFANLMTRIHNFDVKKSRWLTIEFFRTVPLVVLASLMFWPDFGTIRIVMYVFGFLLVIALISHTIRTALFPYINLRDFGNRSLESPLSASIVFFGFCLIICTVMVVAADFFK